MAFGGFLADYFLELAADTKAFETVDHIKNMCVENRSVILAFPWCPTGCRRAPKGHSKENNCNLGWNCESGCACEPHEQFLWLKSAQLARRFFLTTPNFFSGDHLNALLTSLLFESSSKELLHLQVTSSGRGDELVTHGVLLQTKR